MAVTMVSLSQIFPDENSPPKQNVFLRSLWPHLKTIAFSMFLVCFIPYLHIGVIGHYVWPAKPAIDRTTCDCKCFDTIYRGRYENPGTTAYKHWYFNATLDAFKIWCLITFGFTVAYESFKYTFSCFQKRDIRYTMLVLFLSTIFPHYYGWWNYLNYYNEEFYEQWYHQLYFTISEFISSAIVLYLVQNSHNVEKVHLLCIFTINISHIIVGGLDQFIAHLINGEGFLFQVVRDFGLVIPDLLALGVVLYESKQLAHSKCTTVSRLFFLRDIFYSSLIIVVMVVIANSL